MPILLKKAALATAISAVFAGIACASSEMSGPMAFDPIESSAYAELTTDPGILTDAPWKLPEGYRQYIVSDENDLDIYPAFACARFPKADWPDMNTVNESKKHAGRYLYRTHEVRPFLMAADSSCRTVDTTAIQAYKDAGGGAVSVVDLETGTAKILAQREDWEALDGIVWTPWHTILFAEETLAQEIPDPDYPAAKAGLLYEIGLAKGDPTTAAGPVVARPMVGSLSHEGIEVDAEGNVYVIDENRKGSIYKFVPENYGDLSSGQLYVLKTESASKTGPATWVALDMDLAQTDAFAAATAAEATTYCRPEDLERIGDTLYAALTCENVADPASTSGAGAVLSITLDDSPKVNYFVGHGVNVVAEDKAAGITGFKSPDNLASGPDGRLWIVEDNVPSDIWVAEPDNDGDGASDGVHLFASLKDDGAEGSGIYFGKDPQTLFVNIQHSVTGDDKTIAITNRKD
jgi:hypothetical protein